MYKYYRTLQKTHKPKETTEKKDDLRIRKKKNSQDSTSSTESDTLGLGVMTEAKKIPLLV